jgi:hypothetical protein
MTNIYESWSTTAGSNTTVAAVSIAEGMTAANVNNGMRAIMAEAKAWADAVSGAKTSTGSADAYVLSTGLSIGTIAQGQWFAFEANFTNTGAVTIAIDTLATKAIRLQDGSALPAGAITSGGVYDIKYEATAGYFLLMNPAPGITAGGLTASARLCHTGGNPANVSTDGTNLSIVVTELYVAEVFIPCNMTVTGVSVFWGDATEGNAKVMLFNSAGTRLALSASTDVSAHTADAYSTRIPFSAAYGAKGPATYYVGVICDTNTHRINTHVIGDFGAGKITGLVYATEAGYATITPPTTFTTGLGPIASLY